MMGHLAVFLPPRLAARVAHKGGTVDRRDVPAVGAASMSSAYWTLAGVVWARFYISGANGRSRERMTDA